KRPLRLDIDTVAAGGARETRFWLHGRLGAEAFPDWLAVPPGMLRGDAAWEGLLAVTARPQGGPAGFQLSMTSDLAGMAVHLPPPLAKPAARRRAFAVRAALAKPGALEVRAAYGNLARSVLMFTGLGDRPRLERGELRVRAGEASLPASPGLHVTAHLERLEWPGSGTLAGGTSAGGALPPWLARIDAHLDEAVIRGYRFPRLHLHADHGSEALTVAVDGETLAGRITVPARPGPRLPVAVELRRLALYRDPQQRKPASPKDWLDPRTLPPLRLTVQELHLEDRPLGRLSLALNPRRDGVRLEALALHSDLHDLTVKGDWRSGGHKSQVAVDLRSKAFGKTLQALGYALALENGPARVKAELRWPAPLYAPDLRRLDGQVSLSIGQGRLLNVEPGVGRVMGLISLQSLSRRLSLDFSDLFDKGLAFDSIQGTFAIADGNAETRDLRLEGPAARIDVSGRIGLSSRDYNQTVIVTPRMSMTLPLAGTLAGGPAVGAALLLAERLFKKEIDQAARYRYTVSGSWDAPVVEPARGAAGGG
nr:hypothetical protein [Pseudomonadota bacterium]